LSRPSGSPVKEKLEKERYSYAILGWSYHQDRQATSKKFKEQEEIKGILAFL